MLLVANVAKAKLVQETGDISYSGLDQLKVKRSLVPATTHVDNSSRIQTVSRESNSRFYQLLTAFKSLTGCPILVNTSFNVRGEPIVCTPADAIRCFASTGLDVLVLGNYIVEKKEQINVSFGIEKQMFVRD